MIFNDKFYPTPLPKLLSLILKQLKKDEVLGLTKELFFEPQENDFFKFKYINTKLDSPIGVAAGPQTQLAQNIIISWLAGARFIELKTIQTLDEIEVSKPCIDIQDEGYNCEWSQELKIQEAFNEYLNAWIIIHILQKELGFKNLGTAFNMSVGYDLKGIMQPNVQWFLNKMTDSSEELAAKIDEIKDIYPQISEIKIPSKLTESITLSTMHGCPPEEIEQIATYLISERKINTIIKLNPTLLGKEKLLEIIHNSGFRTNVPDIAFEHDLKYDDAIEMISRLRLLAEKNNIFFSIKLTNTLETTNNKDVFQKENEMMYMSGRALHPISVNIARKLQNEFNGKLKISFSGGADAYNVTDLIASGLQPITVSSDLLKPGGYGRLHQYYDILREAGKNQKTIDEFILSKGKSSLKNLNNYADKVLQDKRYKKNSFSEPSIKTNRKLGNFDCIAAPCVDTCPTNQKVPQYMYQVQTKNLAEAIKTVMVDNPFPTVTGYICDHTCQLKCTRINYDSALNIREIKRYIAEKTKEINVPKKHKKLIDTNVAIIGAGPGGMSAAYYLLINGANVEIFEKNEQFGGMVANAIPSFRLQDEQVDLDINRILKLGAKVNYNYEVNFENFQEIKKKYDYVFVAPGAQASLAMELPGFDNENVFDSLDFFYKTRNNQKLDIGKNVAVIGGGNTAMDAARIAKRLVGNNGKVMILYRRTKEYMPAHYHEIVDTIAEGIEFIELVEPLEAIIEDGKLTGIKLIRTELIPQEKGKRPKPLKIPGSEFILGVSAIIPAIGQLNNFDFLKEYEYRKKEIPFTRYDNIFIGGDAVRGAASAIKAIADGKKAAYEILNDLKADIIKTEKNKKEIDYKTLKIKKATRQLPVVPENLALDKRNNFNIVTKTYTDEQAIEEASRCLLCDELCDVCVSVCPNLANQGYWVEPFSFEIPEIIFKEDKAKVIYKEKFEIKQSRQTYNIADWCNECGNCATFCPSAGKPYLDKPKVHLSEQSFEQSPSGYHFTTEDGLKVLKYKTAENNFKLKFYNDYYCFESDNIKAQFNTDLKLENFEIKKPFEKIKLDAFAQMFVISKINIDA